MRAVSIIQTSLLLMFAGYGSAQDHGWYDVPAIDLSIAEQLVAISDQGIPVQLLFVAADAFEWNSPALHNVRGWFSPAEAFCLALAGTPLAPIEVGPEWIRPPRADWK